MASARMSVQDELWLTMDRPNNLMVVDGAMLLRGQPTLAEVAATYQAMVDRFPVFRRRATQRGGNWVWEDDPDFAVANHLSEVALPEPRDLASLQAFMAEQRSMPLDLDRPRWLAFYIPALTLSDGSTGSAVVSRFHHSIADGVRLTQVMLGMCDTPDSGLEAVVARGKGGDSGSGGIPIPLGAIGHAVADISQGAVSAAFGALETTARAVRHPRTAARSLPAGARRATESVSDAAGAAADVVGRVRGATRLGTHGIEDGIELVRHPDRLLDALEVLGIEGGRSVLDASSLTKIALGSSPHTVWSGKPGTEKAIAWSEPMPLAGIKATAGATGTTVNDVLLAAVAGGLRQYLDEHGGSVDEVSWMVPVNLKPFEENLPEDLGNYFALVFLPMPLWHETSEERLEHMHQLMARIKHSDEAVLTFGLQRVVSMSPAQIAFFLTNFFANKAIGVLTNVPGPRSELTFGGVPVEQVVGFAPCSGDQPMTATIFSYNGGVTVGFATDAGLVPDPQVLVSHVVAEVGRLAGAES